MRIVIDTNVLVSAALRNNEDPRLSSEAGVQASQTAPINAMSLVPLDADGGHVAEAFQVALFDLHHVGVLEMEIVDALFQFCIEHRVRAHAPVLRQ